MKINLHIERLVLEDVPMSAAEKLAFQAAIRTELTHLLGSSGVSEELRAGMALTHMRAGTVRLNENSGPKKLGTDVAHAIYQAVGHNGRDHSGETRSANVDRQSFAKNRRSLPGGNPR
jgi:hypothetical protein